MEFEELNIVFFDGVCGLCNRAVDFLMKRDGSNRLHFASLQGETAKQLLTKEQLQQRDTIVYSRRGVLMEKSDAVTCALADIGGIWRLGAGLRVFPKGLRDWVYDGISRKRYRWFGKRDVCRVPTEDEQGRMLA